MTPFVRRSVILTAVVAVSTLLVTACSSSGSSNSSSGSSGSAAAGTEAKGSFTIGSVSSGMPDLPLLAALDDMRKQGYDPKYVALNQGAEIAAQGVQSGRFEFGSGANNTFELAIQAGADMRMIVDREDVVWGLYSKKSITSCAQLDGKKVAVQSPSSTTKALLMSYIDSKCPGTKPNILIIVGSENRYAALLAGQIDATPLELQDAVKLGDDPKGNTVTQLADFGKELPKLNVFSQFVNNAWAKKHPQTVKDFIKAMLDQYRKIDGHPDYLASLWDQYHSAFGDLANGTEAAYEAYSHEFPVNGGMTEDEVKYSIDFYNTTGAGIKLTPDQVMDDSYLKAVLAEVGTV